jgi:hypothetical protein
MRLFSIIGSILLAGFVIFWKQSTERITNVSGEKLYGLSLESPPKPIDSVVFSSVIEAHPSYVAIIPYGFSRQGRPTVHYQYDHHWWGESYRGVARLIEMARAQDLKIMLKPHVWIEREGWPGDFTLAREEDWIEWERTYRSYVLGFASLADSLNVELFCIGTEFRKVVVERPQFWVELISEVRSLYSGKITYAANWDNYTNVTFWPHLDYIGIDAYFPLDTALHPTRAQLSQSWAPIVADLESFSSVHDRPILFTEYGYRSVCRTTGPHWELDDYPFDEATQETAYRAIFDAVWSQPWFAGGFLWKWRFYPDIGGYGDTGYTPQGKSAMTTISSYYHTDE